MLRSILIIYISISLVLGTIPMKIYANTSVSIQNEKYEVQMLDITVSAIVPIHINEYGETITNNTIDIVNNNNTDIVITDVIIEELNDWKLAYIEDINYDTIKVGSKTYSLELNGIGIVEETVYPVETLDSIAVGATYSLDYEIRVAPQSEAISEKLVRISFVVGSVETLEEQIVTELDIWEIETLEEPLVTEDEPLEEVIEETLEETESTIDEHIETEDSNTDLINVDLINVDLINVDLGILDETITNKE